MLHFVPDDTNVFLYARSEDENGKPKYRPMSIVAWSIDDKAMTPKPVFFDPPEKGETVVRQINGAYIEVSL